MNLKTIAGLALAALLVTGSAAALPGNAPAQADEYANDNADAADAKAPETGEQADADAAENQSDAETTENQSDADRRGPPSDVPAASDDRRGPPIDLPAAVPDFVSEIHSLLNDKLAGDLEGSLGEQISDVTPDEESSENSSDADASQDTETSDDSETETNA
jgi:hypothetical protein